MLPAAPFSFEGIMSEDVRTALLERSAHVAYQSSVNHL